MLARGEVDLEVTDLRATAYNFCQKERHSKVMYMGPSKVAALEGSEETSFKTVRYAILAAWGCTF